MDSSILEDIKKMIGIQPEYTVYDTDIIVNINAAIGVLNQIGIGVDDFFLLNKSQTWNDLLGTNKIGFQIVKDYIYLKVRNVFDPPTSSTVIQANNSLIKEYEYRLNVLYETNAVGSHSSKCCEGLTPDQLNSLESLLEGENP